MCSLSFSFIAEEDHEKDRELTVYEEEQERTRDSQTTEEDHEKG